MRTSLGRRTLALTAVAGLVAAGLTATASPAGAQPGAFVDREVYAELATDGSTEFFVYLTETADLSPAAALDQKVDKTAFVHQRLTSVAERSQAPLRAALDVRGIDYTPFWIANTLLVTGDRALVDELAGRPDVARIEPNREYQIMEPALAPDDIGINVIEWGVANINADDVWNQFDVRGEGIVVGNIDTGVRFTHNAVVNQYRGNNGGNFNHNFNWWDPTGQCGNTPCDNNNHGTHTMGTMVGDDGGSNQIGVAPEAEWIAAKGCATNSCASNHLLSSGQFMVAPTDLNGNNANPALAPDVVNNSWGGGRGDTWYQATINAWINGGIFPMFSIGNSGQFGCATANSPGDNIPAYGVGAYDINNNLASFSSRGPSGVSSSEIKPNIAAPGVSVRSSTAGSNSSYANFSGTSMASPHASGVVALVWSAAPSLRGSINATKALLDDTARDVNSTGCGGTADDNNNFGEGRIDALAAVEEATGGGGDPPEVVFEDDFETNQGWTTNFDGSDTATTGQWARANPAGTSFSGTTLQLGTTTSGVNDLVTGPLAGSNAGVHDIDNGDTTVRSPAISLPAGATIELEFNYYLAHLSNATNADYFRVTVQGPGGSSNVFQELGTGSNQAGSWSSQSVNLSSFAGQTIRLLVEAADASSPSLIEAGVDDVVITAS